MTSISTLEPTGEQADMDLSSSLKRPLSLDFSPTSTKQSTNKTGECICPICLDPIVDASKSKKKGQDSIFCEGQYSAWLHRQCAGLSNAIFDYWTKSDNPFQCPHCTLQEHALEIAKLKEKKPLNP